MGSRDLSKLILPSRSHSFVRFSVMRRPRRTRTSSGSVVRIFRGEFVAQLGGTLSAQGLDRRVLVKEFTGNLALALARAELESLGRLQSDLMAKVDDSAKRGEWIRTAASRSVQLRQDNANVAKLVKSLASAPFLGILGTCVCCVCAYGCRRIITALEIQDDN